MALRWPSYLLGIGAGVTTGLEKRAERTRGEKEASAERLLTLAGLAEKGVPVEDLRTLADEWGVTKYYPKSIGIFGGLGEKYKARQMAEFDKEMGEISKKYRPEELELAIQEGTDLGKALGLSEEEARERIKRLHTTERLILPPLPEFKPEIFPEFKVPPTKPLKFTGLPELKTELKTPYYGEEKEPTAPLHVEWEKELRTPVTEFERKLSQMESIADKYGIDKKALISGLLGIKDDEAQRTRERILAGDFGDDARKKLIDAEKQIREKVDTNISEVEILSGVQGTDKQRKKFIEGKKEIERIKKTESGEGLSMMKFYADTVNKIRDDARTRALDEAKLKFGAKISPLIGAGGTWEISGEPEAVELYNKRFNEIYEDLVRKAVDMGSLPKSYLRIISEPAGSPPPEAAKTFEDVGMPWLEWGSPPVKQHPLTGRPPGIYRVDGKKMKWDGIKEIP